MGRVILVIVTLVLASTCILSGWVAVISSGSSPLRRTVHPGPLQFGVRPMPGATAFGSALGMMGADALLASEQAAQSGEDDRLWFGLSSEEMLARADLLAIMAMALDNAGDASANRLRIHAAKLLIHAQGSLDTALELLITAMGNGPSVTDLAGMVAATDALRRDPRLGVIAQDDPLTVLVEGMFVEFDVLMSSGSWRDDPIAASKVAQSRLKQPDYFASLRATEQQSIDWLRTISVKTRSDKRFDDLRKQLAAQDAWYAGITGGPEAALQVLRRDWQPYATDGATGPEYAAVRLQAIASTIEPRALLADVSQELGNLYVAVGPRNSADLLATMSNVLTTAINGLKDGSETQMQAAVVGAYSGLDRYVNEQLLLSGANDTTRETLSTVQRNALMTLASWPRASAQTKAWALSRLDAINAADFNLGPVPPR